ncbi:MAG TPA: DUF488 domain-containing protein [Candidatus Limnocylindrales bacterium]|nr:DUF488 domain-containing protein [Candidatus Limnocylindrales bacterium]
MSTIFTIGHSTLPLESFLNLLSSNEITAIADVRSEPFSGRLPQYNREPFKEDLAARGVSYVFLGKELGARPRDDAMYEDDRVRYDLLATTPRFTDGIARVREGARKFRLALMCAEGDPLFCHRSLLISRRLSDEGEDVIHIHPSGALETQGRAMERLLELHRLPAMDVFGEQSELVALASARQEGRIAFRRTKSPLDRR